MYFWVMENSNNGAKANGKAVAAPTPEQVKEWCKKDLMAAHYFFGCIISDPEMVEALGEMMYQKAMEIASRSIPEEKEMAVKPVR